MLHLLSISWCIRIFGTFDDGNVLRSNSFDSFVILVKCVAKFSASILGSVFGSRSTMDQGFETSSFETLLSRECHEPDFPSVFKRSDSFSKYWLLRNSRVFFTALSSFFHLLAS